jgi:hypothetical protein
MASPNPTPTSTPNNIRTRILILSDTHGLVPCAEGKTHLPSYDSYSEQSGEPVFLSAFRQPLPRADVVIHCGDLTKHSTPAEYADTLAMLASLDCSLKIAIPGNHDMALDERSWPVPDRRHSRDDDREQQQPGGGGGGGRKDGGRGRRKKADFPAVIRGMVAEARVTSGVHVLVEEGTYDFALGNGARLRVYASPWTPVFGGWGFQYRGAHEFRVEPGTDVVVTHGPPKGVLDRTLYGGERAGCGYLMRAVERVRPRVHCFGHIHEAWGAMVRRWEEGKDVVVENLDSVEGAWDDKPAVMREKVARRNVWAEKRARTVDLCHFSTTPGAADEDRGPDTNGATLSGGFEPGRDTLFVNAAIVDIGYEPRNMPWLVDLELPRADQDDAARARETAARIARDYERAQTAAESI